MKRTLMTRISSPNLGIPHIVRLHTFLALAFCVLLFGPMLNAIAQEPEEAEEPQGILAISIVSGNMQLGIYEEELDPLQVLVTMNYEDGESHDLSGVQVTFALIEGDGTLDNLTDTTDDYGIASVALTLGNLGRHRVTATIDDPKLDAHIVEDASSVTFTAASVREEISIVSGDGQEATSLGTLTNPLQVLVALNDGTTSGAEGLTSGGISVTFAVIEGNGYLDNSPNRTVTKETGYQGITSVLFTVGDVGTNRVTATIENGESVTFTATATAAPTINLPADAAPSVSSAEIAQVIALLTMDKVIFSEIFNASNNANDWLELRNITDTDVDLTGWSFILHTVLGQETVTFPEGAIIPAGEVLLLTNTEVEATGDSSVNAIVDETFDLPQMDFALVLQSADGSFEDAMGNYFPNREKPATAPLLTADTAWYRAKPAVIGYQTEAWIASGSGTPGAEQRLLGDANTDGVVNILDLVLVAAQFGETGDLDVDLNADGVVNIQDLVIVAIAFDTVAAAPSAQNLHASHVQRWVQLAQQVESQPGDTSYQRGIAALERLAASLIPRISALLPNYPNPFNPETWIPYRLSKPSEVAIHIYDARGSVVRQLDLGYQPAGLYQTRSRAVYWDGKNDTGESVASGVYFYTLTAGEFSATRKMLILK